MNKLLAAAVGVAVLIVSPVSALAEEWSAYAIDYEGGWRWSGTQHSADEAEAEAFRMCWGWDGECGIILNVEDACVALADTTANGEYAYGYAPGYNRMLAEVQALAQCTRQGLPGCHVVHSGCP